MGLRILLQGVGYIITESIVVDVEGMNDKSVVVDVE